MALSPTAPPTPGVQPVQQGDQQQAPTQPGQPSPEDLQDQTDFVNGQRYDVGKYNNEVSHRTGMPIEVPEITPAEQDPRMVKLEEIRARINDPATGLSPKEMNTAMAQWRRDRADVIRAIDADNRQKYIAARQKHIEELKGIDTPFADVVKRGQYVDYVDSKVIDPLRQYYGKGIIAHPTDPDHAQLDPNSEKFRSNQYTLKTSPLSTMEPMALRDVVTSIGMHNPQIQSADEAAQIALTIGSPVELRQNNEHFGHPFNGQRGAGGSNYDVLGRDYHKFWIVELPGGRVVRLSPSDYDSLSKARAQGYRAARQYFRDEATARAEAAKPDLIQRGYHWLTGR